MNVHQNVDHSISNLFDDANKMFEIFGIVFSLIGLIGFPVEAEADQVQTYF